MVSRICVEGYDTSLHAYDLVISMRKHFASCGEVIHVYTPGYADTRKLYRFALVYLRGEDAEEKALKLSGSSMEGRHTIVVKAYPFGANNLDSELAPMRDADNRQHYMMGVRGYASSLPVDDVEDMLMKHFSECGHMVRISVGPSMAYLTLEGQDTTETALQLGGEGMEKLEVYRVVPPNIYSTPNIMPPWFYEDRPLARRVARIIRVPWMNLKDFWYQIRAPPELSAEDLKRSIRETPVYPEIFD
ncbi:unnamed protein product [Thlaspi arvense]|uniref:RRM domain-containing protein n=1 Tax=Thlaspi arvense TaxID=13288 RepID=A0AAU9SQS7_THLAR|nr:unnamed protein product [Thlaspi arvense]